MLSLVVSLYILIQKILESFLVGVSFPALVAGELTFAQSIGVICAPDDPEVGSLERIVAP